MDIILTLTIRHLKKNKKRSLSTITGILMASILLSLTFIFMTSYLRMLENSEAAAEDIIPLTTAAAVMMAVILAVLAIFVYNMLSISVRDRIRYLGMLGSVGATPVQRGKMALLESAILGGIAILPGIAAGSVLSFAVFPFPVYVSPVGVLLIFLGEGVMVLLTGLVLAIRSGKSRVIELVQNRIDRRKLKKSLKVPEWILFRFGVEGYFATKNLVFFKSRYLAIGITFVISMVLLLDGYIYMNYLDGYYQVQDRREKKIPDLVVEEWYGKKSGCWDEFIAEITALPEVKEYEVSKRANYGGILLDSASINPGLDTFSTSILGTFYENPTTIYDAANKKKKGYCMNMTLIGLDEKSFALFRKKSEVTGNGYGKEGQIPVIIEDFPLIRTSSDLKYQSVLDIQDGSELKVWADVNQSMIGASPEMNPVTGFEKFTFHVGCYE